MNGEGKKHTLRFDPRTELLLLVLANIVAFTQHSGPDAPPFIHDRGRRGTESAKMVV